MISVASPWRLLRSCRKQQPRRSESNNNMSTSPLTRSVPLACQQRHQGWKRTGSLHDEPLSATTAANATSRSPPVTQPIPATAVAIDGSNVVLTLTNTITNNQTITLFMAIQPQRTTTKPFKTPSKRRSLLEHHECHQQFRHCSTSITTRPSSPPDPDAWAAASQSSPGQHDHKAADNPSTDTPHSSRSRRISLSLRHPAWQHQRTFL